MATQTYIGTLVIWPCAECGMDFGVTSDFAESARKDGRQIFCPRGHVMRFRETEADKLRKALASERSSKTFWQDQTRAAEREVSHQRAVARGYKGALVKTKKRVGKGACPCCNRSFADLAAHMATKHPDYAE